MAINWGEVEETYSGDFKDYAPEGTFKVKCVDVEPRKVSDGAYVLDFIFEEDDKYQYPKAGCYITNKKEKEKWRWHYVKNLFVVLGASEDKAKQVVEKAEEKGDYEFAIKAYEASFKRLLAKKPEAEINVYFSGRMSKKGNPINNAEFTDSRIRMKRQEQKVAEVVGGEVVPTDIPNGDINFGEIPF